MINFFYLKKINSLGFTLLEVLLICLIIGITAFLVSPCFQESVQDISCKAAETELLKIKGAVELYYLDTGRYPESISGLWENTQEDELWQGPYLNENPSANGSWFFYIDKNGQVTIENRGK